MRPLVLSALTLLLVATVSCQSDDPSATEDVFYVRHNGADMPAYVYGNASSNTFVILLHGGPGGSGLEYRFGQYSQQLEERYAMVYFDQRGQGMAQGQYSPEDITLDNMVDDVRALALTLKAKYGEDISLFLMGHSWGGTLGTAVVVKEDYQSLFKGWIEVDGAHDLPLTYAGGIRLFQQVGNDQVAAGNSPEFWEEILERVNGMSTNPAEALDEDILYLNQKGFEAEGYLQDAGILYSGDTSNLGQLFANILVYNNLLTSFWSGSYTNQSLYDKGLEQYTATPELGKVTIPTLLMWGRYDFVVNPEVGETALQALGSADKELVYFEGSGHSPMDSEPALFVNTVITFIERNR